MLKYLNYQVTFSEIPDEVTLCLNLTNCPYKCPDCHSKELWNDIGEELTFGKLRDIISDNNGISCICFMGGDSDLDDLYDRFQFCSLVFPDIKIAWYTGRENIPKDLPKCVDFIKIGPYKSEFGPINNQSTNQIFYTRGRNLKKMDVNSNMFYNTTDKFWK